MGFLGFLSSFHQVLEHQKHGPEFTCYDQSRSRLDQHIFSHDISISQCEFWKLLIQKKWAFHGLFTSIFAAKSESESAKSPWFHGESSNEALAV
jgi:hypothetical protein